MLAVLVASIAAANAQFFVEANGRISYGGSDFTLDGSSRGNYSSHMLNASALLGYQLNEKMAFGFKSSFGSDSWNSLNLDLTEDETPTKMKGQSWSLAVFNRYQLWRIKKFSFLVESSLFIGGGSIINKNGAVVNLDQTMSSFGFNMEPKVTYALSGRFTLIATGSFLNLELASRTTTHDVGLKLRRNSFGFTGQSKIFSVFPFNGIGVIYHFNHSGK